MAPKNSKKKITNMQTVLQNSKNILLVQSSKEKLSYVKRISVADQ